MEKKFNKANVSDLIIQEIDYIEAANNFKSDNGMNQISGEG